MTLRTGGLNGIIQPYQIFVAEPQSDGPYEQRSKLTTNPQDDALFQSNKIFQEGKMVSTEYRKGHGVANVEEGHTTASSSVPGDSSTETVHIVHINPYSEKDQVQDKSEKMSKTEIDKTQHNYLSRQIHQEQKDQTLSLLRQIRKEKHTSLHYFETQLNHYYCTFYNNNIFIISINICIKTMQFFSITGFFFKNVTFLILNSLFLYFSGNKNVYPYRCISNSGQKLYRIIVLQTGIRQEILL